MKTLILSKYIQLTDDYMARYEGNGVYHVVRTTYPLFEDAFRTEDNKEWCEYMNLDLTDDIKKSFEKGENIAAFFADVKILAGLFLQWFIRQPAKVTNIEFCGRRLTVVRGLRITDEEREKYFKKPLEDWRKEHIKNI